MKKQLAVVLCGSMLMSSLCFGTTAFAAEPQTAAELYEAYLAGDHDNYHMNMKLDLKVNADGEGFAMEIPVNMSMDLDVADKYGHGNMNMYMSMMGQVEEQKAEIYYDAAGDEPLMYTCEDGVWSVSTDSSGIVDITDSMMNADVFTNATLDTSEDTYIISLPMSVLLENEEYADMLGSSVSVLDSFGSDADSGDFLDVLGQSNIIYTFDSDLNLLSIDMDDFNYTAKVEEGDMTIDMTMFMDIVYTLSDFGRIEESMVMVPDDVKAKATDSDTTGLGIGGDSDIDDMFSGDGSTVDVRSDVEDFYGAIDGKSLGLNGDDFASTFGAAGFDFDMSSDGQYGFAVCTSEKYPDVDLYVYNADRANTTKADVEENGFYGYSVETVYADAKPNMSFCGVTWGAAPEDIKAAYGQPSYEYDGDMFLSYEYKISDTVTMDFYFYKDENYNTGLQRAELTIYNF